MKYIFLSKKLILLLLLLFIVIIIINWLKKNNNFEHIKYNENIKIPYFYVITVNNQNYSHRQKLIKDLFKNLDIKYEFTYSIDHNKINIDEFNKHDKKIHKHLSSKEISLALKHNELYKKLLDSNNEFIIICEDDIRFKDNFIFNLKLILSNLPKDFDIVQLEYINNIKHHNNINSLNPKDVPNYKLKKINYTQNLYPGAACYIVNREGAKKILKLNQPIWLPADGIFDPKHQKIKNIKLNVYNSNPRLAWQYYTKNVKSIN